MFIGELNIFESPTLKRINSLMMQKIEVGRFDSDIIYIFMHSNVKKALLFHVGDQNQHRLPNLCAERIMPKFALEK